MSKKGKLWSSREVYSRMNFLYQASLSMAGTNNMLSCYYGNLCKMIGKKAVLRIDPAIKRNICKRCGCALKPGITTSLEMHHEKRLNLICKICGFERNFIINNNYNFWLENPSSIVESYTICDQSTTKINKSKKNTEITNKHDIFVNK